MTKTQTTDAVRVLWFSVTPSMYASRGVPHNGGGWIASLEGIVRGLPQVELGIAFVLPGEPEGPCRHDGVTYYPMPRPQGGRSRRREALMEQCERVIADFKPDVIQIFGSENEFGPLCSRTSVPVVIHMQGSMPAYHNAQFPVGMNKWDFLLGRGLSLRRRLIGLRTDSAFGRAARREIATIEACRHFMGRTRWDRDQVELFNPRARYHHCEEALRPSFRQEGRSWEGPRPGRQVIVSVISNPWYKGMDLVLKTAQLLRRHTPLDFEWQVYGVSDVRFYERKYGIKGAREGVRVMGTASPGELVDALCRASVYVHPGYIENSPNSLCEAQLLGLPVVATYVGGIPSLVEEGRTGLLVPANAPHTLAPLLQRLLASPERARALGAGARTEALRRHDPDAIGRRILDIYREIAHSQPGTDTE